ncbi:MAG: CRTAC1 family protein [Hyphomonadaceae bacterium]
MKWTFCLSVIALSAAACASPQRAEPQATCAPRFDVRDFQPGGEADRGWPGGVSVADVNDDGALDIYITGGYEYVAERGRNQQATPSMLYLNDGRGQFTRAEANPISNAAALASGSTWADIDHDGDLDAFSATELGHPDVFYRNAGDGLMQREDLSAATTTRGGNFTASWADIDGDGDLDLIVGGAALENPSLNLVYRNDGGNFVRVTGVPIENGLSNPVTLLWGDVDNDGRPDLFVSNSDLWRAQNFPPGPGENEYPVLYRNLGDWRFEPMGGEGFSNHAFPGAAAAFGDIDNDGDLDLFLGMYVHPGAGARDHDRLFINDGHGVFTEARDFAAAEHADATFGAAFADFDIDGDLDLIFVAFNDEIHLMAGDGAGHFSAVQDAALSDRRTTHSGLAVGDFDSDGLADVIIGNWPDGHDGRFPTLLQNRSAPCGDWIDFDVRDQYGAPNPPGARIVLISVDARGRERRQLREASAQTGFRSQSASYFLFGLPAHERVLRAEIRWPDGATRTIRSLPRNRRVHVRVRANG